jgi:hypothetical protein
MTEPSPPDVPESAAEETQSLPEETQTPPDEASSEPEQVPPSPPDFLRPAEPIYDDNIVKESVPVPVNPVPELPSRPVPPLQEDEITFSRTVRAKVGQFIEVPFKGTGWVFLGELTSQRGISYDSRRLDAEGQSFVFLAEEPGTYMLKFYKEDYIRDYILNDHVQVIVEEAPEPTGTGWFNPPSDWSRVIAEPRWPDETESVRLPPDSSQSSAAQPVSEIINPTESSSLHSLEEAIPETSTEFPAADSSEENTASTLPENAFPEEYFQKAQEEFDAGNITEAISILEQFRQRVPSGSDEAYWLLGQFYEANSSSKDIRTSLDYYRRLTNEYPQSKRYTDARARIAYLERYYLNIR